MLTVDYSAALIVNQDLTSEGIINLGTGTGGSLTVKGTYTQASGARTSMTSGSLSGSFTSHTAGYALTTNANSIVVTKQ